MAVTKRTRYEVLKRDNHACRYCGGIAPDVKLTIDHVVPVALGGSDDPSNLVAACQDCNAGKSSSAPDAALVADVSQDALNWANAVKSAMEQLRDDLTEREKYRKAFLRHWRTWDKSRVMLPAGWTGTLASWHAIGVPIELLREATDIAMGHHAVSSGNVFRYMCGVVWRKVDDAREKVAPKPAPEPIICGHCYACRENETCYLIEYGPDEADKCRMCGEPDCIYEMGYGDGSADGYFQGRDIERQEREESYAQRDVWTRLLEFAIDDQYGKREAV